MLGLRKRSIWGGYRPVTFDRPVQLLQFLCFLFIFLPFALHSTPFLEPESRSASHLKESDFTSRNRPGLVIHSGLSWYNVYRNISREGSNEKIYKTDYHTGLVFSTEALDYAVTFHSTDLRLSLRDLADGIHYLRVARSDPGLTSSVLYRAGPVRLGASTRVGDARSMGGSVEWDSALGTVGYGFAQRSWIFDIDFVIQNLSPGFTFHTDLQEHTAGYRNRIVDLKLSRGIVRTQHEEFAYTLDATGYTWSATGSIRLNPVSLSGHARLIRADGLLHNRGLRYGELSDLELFYGSICVDFRLARRLSSSVFVDAFRGELSGPNYLNNAPFHVLARFVPGRYRNLETDLSVIVPGVGVTYNGQKTLSNSDTLVWSTETTLRYAHVYWEYSYRYFGGNSSFPLLPRSSYTEETALDWSALLARIAVWGEYRSGSYGIRFRMDQVVPVVVWNNLTDTTNTVDLGSATQQPRSTVVRGGTSISILLSLYL